MKASKYIRVTQNSKISFHVNLQRVYLDDSEGKMDHKEDEEEGVLFDLELHSRNNLSFEHDAWSKHDWKLMVM